MAKGMTESEIELVEWMASKADEIGMAHISILVDGKVNVPAVVDELNRRGYTASHFAGEVSAINMERVIEMFDLRNPELFKQKPTDARRGGIFLAP